MDAKINFLNGPGALDTLEDRRVGRQLKPGGVRLTEIIDPSRHPLTCWGPAPLLARFQEATADPASFHLAVMAAAWKLKPEIAVAVFLENPYAQYFCGFDRFQHEFGKERNLREYCARLSREQMHDADRHLGLLRLFSRPVKERAGKPGALLREAVSPLHWISLSARLMPWEKLEALSMPGKVSPECFRLALISGQNPEAAEQPARIREIFLSNVYWQYFCGFEHFQADWPGSLEGFEESWRQLRASRRWREAGGIAERVFRRSLETSSQRNPGLWLFLNDKVGRLLDDLSPANLPPPMEVPGAYSPEGFAELARFFLDRQWRVTAVASDDLILAQKNLFGPRLRFVRATDTRAREEAIGGRDGFSDVVLKEARGPEPAQIKLVTAGPADLMGRLDRALTRAANLEEFLRDRETQLLYFDALALGFPGRVLPRRSFDAILGQLRELLPEIPELGPRLWDPRPAPPSFHLRVGIPSYGRELREQELRDYVARFLSSLGKRRSISYAEIKRITRETGDVLARIENRRRAAGGSREGAEGANEAYARLRRSEPVQRVVKELLYAYFECPIFEETLRSGDADRVLRLFDATEGSLLHVLGNSGIVNDVGFWVSAVRPLLPSLSRILSLKKVFPPLQRKTRRGRSLESGQYTRASYELVPVARGLHGLWCGIYWKDCVGGHPDMLNQLMPERWARPALEGASMYYAMSGGTIHGSCQVVPFEIGGKRYGSLDTQWHELFIRHVRNDGRKRLAFEVWLSELRQRAPENWEGFAVGCNPAGRDPFESERLQESNCFRRGRKIGTSEEVRFTDPLAEKIRRLSERKGYGTRFRPLYGSRILTDVSIGISSPVFALS